MGLRADLLAAVLADLPTPDSTLSETSNPDRWDALLGGKTGSGTWGRYERGYGTTCGVAANGWLLEVGAPPEMINAAPPGGSGFTIGAHISRINQGAQSLGWLRTPTRGQLPDFKPGDLYEINHTTSDGSDGTHIGVVLSVTPSEDGQSLAVETADGGQGTRQAQSAKRSTRTFSLSSGAHPVAVQSPSGTGWLDRWVSVGGDAPDNEESPAPSTLPSGVTPGGATPSDGFAVAAGFAGLGLALLGGYWYLRGDYDLPRGIFALQTGAREMDRQEIEQAVRAELSRGYRVGVADGSGTITTKHYPRVPVVGDALGWEEVTHVTLLEPSVTERGPGADAIVRVNALKGVKTPYIVAGLAALAAAGAGLYFSGILPKPASAPATTTPQSTSKVSAAPTVAAALRPATPGAAPTVASIAAPTVASTAAPTAPVYPDGTLVKGSGPAIYVVRGGQKLWIPDPPTFNALGYSWGAVQTIPDASLTAIPTGTQIPSQAPPPAAAPAPSVPTPAQAMALGQTLLGDASKIPGLGGALGSLGGLASNPAGALGSLGGLASNPAGALSSLTGGSDPLSSLGGGDSSALGLDAGS